MPLYLSPYVGKGTRDNPFRPVGTDQPGWSAIDLRADGGCSLDGAGFPYCLLWLPNGSVEDPSQIKLADGKDELLAVSSRQQLGSKSILDLSQARTIGDALEELLLRPKASGWNPLAACKGIYEAWLGSDEGKVRWVAKASLAFGGGSITDSFTRADETPVNTPWTRDPNSVGGQVNLTSGGLVKVTTTGDAFYYYSRPDGWGADQSSEMTDVIGVTQSDWGPAVRIGSNGFSCYFYSQYTGVATQRVYKCVAGTFTNIVAALGITTTNTPYKIEAIGSTINYYDNGVADANSPITDTALVSGGSGPGFQLFQLGGSLDNWTGTGEAAASSYSSASRFGFSPNRAPWRRRALHPTKAAESIADLNVPPVIDEQVSASRSRFGWSPMRRPMQRRILRASAPAPDVSTLADTTLACGVTLSITQSSALTTSITMAAGATVSITISPALSTAITMAVSMTVSITQTAALTTSITMAASPIVSITVSLTLSTAITMAASMTVSITQTAALTTSITMACAMTASITIGADLTAGAGIASSVTLAITVSPALNTAIPLASAVSVSIAIAVALSTGITFASAPTLSLTTTAALNTSIRMASAMTVSIVLVADFGPDFPVNFIRIVGVVSGPLPTCRNTIGRLSTLKNPSATMPTMNDLAGVL